MTAGIGPERMAARVAAELPAGRVATLATGLPQRVADHLLSIIRNIRPAYSETLGHPECQ